MTYLSFLGGAGTVTGSKILLEAAGNKVLIDCGLFQGVKELRKRNWEPLPVNPADIDAVLLTHAHIDHSGYLPLLVKNGFHGKIYCTRATFELCQVLLPDSGYLQEEDAKRANLYRYSKHNPALSLYTEMDAKKCLKYFEIVNFHQDYDLFNLRCRWNRAGHILGASWIEVHNGNKTFIFSGDLGRPDDPLMLAPEQPSACDILVIESTYGNRRHPLENILEVLAQYINKTSARGGTILLPAFAVGRTQALLYYLDQLTSTQRIPKLPIYLDSPMAIDATKILQSHGNEHRLSTTDCQNICQRVKYIQSADESKELDTMHHPKIIISASGMMTGGRILHHLKFFGPNSRNTILITGYQAIGTRGARLLNHEKTLKIHGEIIPIRAEIAELTSASAHADYTEILKWIEGFQIKPKQIFINHGEAKASAQLQQFIEEQFAIKCIVPDYKQRYKL